MSSLVSRVVAADPKGLSNRVILQLDATAVRMAYELSIQDPRHWYPHTDFPFENFILEWSPADYLDAEDITLGGKVLGDNDPDDRVKAVAFDYVNGVGTFPMAVPKGKGFLYSPFLISRSPKLEGDAYREYVEGTLKADLHAAVLKLAWGIDWSPVIDEYPEDVKVFVHPELLKRKLTAGRITEFAAMCAGQLRIVMAAIALMNTHRESIVVPASQRDGRTIVGGRNVPKYKPHLVVIRPDAVRRIVERDPDAVGHGSRKRNHEVRRHLRRYKTGRTVWVREHRRGDEALGRVTKKYLIEADPNKDLNNGV